MTVEQFGRRLQAYFSRQYTPVQVEEIKRWARRYSERALEIVYHSVVAEEDFLPLIGTLNRHMARVYSGYPELLPESYNRNRQLELEEPELSDEEVEANLAKLRDIVGLAVTGCKVPGERDQ